MLNRVILMGRITQDLEVRQTPNGVSALTFNVAVDRNFKDQSGQYQSDFITCVAWRQTAEFIGKYFGKGRLIALEGTLRSRTYEDKNGTKHYVTEVYVENASFTGEKAQQGGGNYSQNYGNGGFNNGGYGNNGGYSNGGNGGFGGNNFNNGGNFGGGFGGNNGGNQNSFNNNNNQAPSNDALNIGDLSEFEDVLSDDGVPF
ncbi:single-stranded DNA-binding protein [Ruminococcus albus]|uniref:Single-stranded DNA-binding protein n=1 Tax=Ruminococcus albus (strain ATCC 27210 / DSM 20455 / JCM 14654 / NCDO 2250 / 7) TaxID=697329 RepID=E6UEW0_RUMA7|nr:single-stranded DNA-binding protein [Ruminococcus albus]ADU22959.1 single-strand binding protein [Ruminococcus albus 7 = DSM 20455]